MEMEERCGGKIWWAIVGWNNSAKTCKDLNPLIAHKLVSRDCARVRLESGHAYDDKDLIWAPQRLACLQTRRSVSGRLISHLSLAHLTALQIHTSAMNSPHNRIPLGPVSPNRPVLSPLRPPPTSCGAAASVPAPKTPPTNTYNTTPFLMGHP
jgi:hypothetical protein